MLGPVDPQLGEYAAASILAAVSQKDVNETDDKTLILADVARKAQVQVRQFVSGLLRRQLDDTRAEEPSVEYLPIPYGDRSTERREPSRRVPEPETGAERFRASPHAASTDECGRRWPCSITICHDLSSLTYINNR